MMRWWKDLDRILRGDATRISALSRGKIDIPVGGLSGVLIILGMAYGMCMGSFALFRSEGPSYLQLLASTMKVPLLFVLTLVVTLPSLYVSNALVGSRLAVDSVVRLLVAGLAAGPFMSSNDFLGAARCAALESVEGQSSWSQAALNAEARRQPAEVAAQARSEVSAIARQAAQADTKEEAADIAAQRNAACASHEIVARGVNGGDAA